MFKKEHIDFNNLALRERANSSGLSVIGVQSAIEKKIISSFELEKIRQTNGTSILNLKGCVLDHFKLRRDSLDKGSLNRLNSSTNTMLPYIEFPIQKIYSLINTIKNKRYIDKAPERWGKEVYELCKVAYINVEVLKVLSYSSINNIIIFEHLVGVSEFEGQSWYIENILTPIFKLTLGENIEVKYLAVKPLYHSYHEYLPQFSTDSQLVRIWKDTVTQIMLNLDFMNKYYIVILGTDKENINFTYEIGRVLKDITEMYGDFYLTLPYNTKSHGKLGEFLVGNYKVDDFILEVEGFDYLVVSNGLLSPKRNHRGYLRNYQKITEIYGNVKGAVGKSFNGIKTPYLGEYTADGLIKDAYYY